MRSLRSIIILTVALGALVAAGVAGAGPTQLSLQEQAVKVKNGKIVLTVTCESDDVCNSVVGARVPMPGGIIIKKGGLGSKIFKLQAGEQRALAFTLTPEVRTWLKSHRRTNLQVFMKAVDGEYGNNWKRELRLPLAA